MKRAGLALAFCLALVVSALGQGGMGPGPGTVHSTGGGYTGPGDVFAFGAWWGLRAYNSATRGTKSINVCNVADVMCADLSTDATTGALVISTIGGSNCSIVTCTVKTIYDKVGTLDCTQATIANRPTFSVAGGPAGNPAALFARSSSQTMTCGSSSGITNTQPFTYSAVAIRTGTTGSFNTVIGSGGPDMLFNSSANGCGIYANSVFVDTTHCADSSWHAIQGMFNNASSKIVIDNNLTSGTAGVAVSTGNYTLGTGIGGLLDGALVEAGVDSGDQSASFTSLNSNQHTFWGF